MSFFKKAAKSTQEAVATDTTIQRTIRYGAKTARALPSAAGQYLVEKVPVVYWLPKYNPRWILNDTLAGITVGVLLIPQSLAYAKIATIPGEYGLMSSWLPNFLVTLMGTSKGKKETLHQRIKLTHGRSIYRTYIAHGFVDC